jgi:hypothetical protein
MNVSVNGRLSELANLDGEWQMIFDRKLRSLWAAESARQIAECEYDTQVG